MSWNPRRKGWVGRERDPTPPVPPTSKEVPMPPVAEELVLIVPDFPTFSPVAIAVLLNMNRGQVHYYLEQGKLHYVNDSIGHRYVLRADLVEFVREYLKKTVQD
jgi:hypothetical protein